MLILPLGHDRQITHFPYITVGVIVLCLLLQAYSCTQSVDEERATRLLMEEQVLRQQIWVQHGPAWMEKRGLLSQKEPQGQQDMMALIRRMQEATRDFFVAYEQGKVVPPDDAQLVRLRQLLAQRQESAGLLALGFRWQDLRQRPYTLITYAFLHAGWLHLVGNMLFLYLCGCNMEDRWGRPFWLVLYVSGAVVSALTFGWIRPGSSMPLVGASGAIAAAMGAFLVVFAKARIRFFYFYMLFLQPRHGTFEMQAFWALPLWLAQQLLGLALENEGTAVAYSAHVGGFVFGLGLALAVRLSGADRTLARLSDQKATLFQEHPRFLQGLEQVDAKDLVGARRSFQAVLRDQPDHLESLVRLAAVEEDPVQAARLASRAVVVARRLGDLSTPRIVYVEHTRLHPGVPLEERALLALGESYQTDAAEEAVHAYSQLLRHYPDGPLAPKAALNLAGLYLGPLANTEAATRVLRQVQTRYAGSPFAERAEELLLKIKN